MGGLRFAITPPHYNRLINSPLNKVEHTNAPIVPSGTVGASPFCTLS